MTLRFFSFLNLICNNGMKCLCWSFYCGRRSRSISWAEAPSHYCCTEIGSDESRHGGGLSSVVPVGIQSDVTVDVAFCMNQ